MDVAPIAEEFFQRLLDGAHPQAMSILSTRWEVRMRPTGTWLGLSRPEHQVTMVLIYQGEVSNGGHMQFFFNRGAVVTRVCAALREIGLVELERILESACALFPGGEVPASHSTVDRILGAWGAGRLAKIGRLDQRAWQSDERPRLLEYLRENESEVLRAERGLDAPR
jgi:hypothetical protein